MSGPLDFDLLRRRALVRWFGVIAALAVVEASVWVAASQTAGDVNRESKARSEQKLQELELTCERQNLLRAALLRDAMGEGQPVTAVRETNPLLDCYSTVWVHGGSAVRLSPPEFRDYMRIFLTGRAPTVRITHGRTTYR